MLEREQILKSDMLILILAQLQFRNLDSLSLNIFMYKMRIRFILTEFFEDVFKFLITMTMLMLLLLESGHIRVLQER